MDIWQYNQMLPISQYYFENYYPQKNTENTKKEKGISVELKRDGGAKYLRSNDLCAPCALLWTI